MKQKINKISQIKLRVCVCMCVCVFCVEINP